MSKPFQFTLRRLLGLVTVFCLELGMWKALRNLLAIRDPTAEVWPLIVSMIPLVLYIWIRYRSPIVGILLAFGVIDCLMTIAFALQALFS